jgi:hypothetical protein
VNSCKQCGAELPEQARFCYQCGAPVDAPEPGVPPPAANIPPPDLEFMQPAVAGGMFLGLLSSLPIVSMGNCVCCAWVLGGGAVATLLLTKQRPSGVTPGDGAFVGVLSGLFGAVIATLVSIPVRILSSRFFESQQQAMEDALREIGAEGPLRDLMLRLASPEISATTLLFTFFMNLLVFSLFAMIGGILTVAILKKRETREIEGRRPNSQDRN